MKTRLFSIGILFLVLMVCTTCTKDQALITPDGGSSELQAITALKAIPYESEVKQITTASGPLSYQCDTYILPNGEIYLICTPVGWTGGDLVVYAHGYISVFEPIQLPVDEIEIALPIAAGFGMAFATTSYSRNGLAVQDGVEQIRVLKQFFIDEYGPPDHSYLAGGSEGGLITTLALEKYPQEFDGGFSLCGPCGAFQQQLNHYGDFRLLFDYFFPGIIPHYPDNPFTNIPPELIEYWENGPSGTPADSYSAMIIAALSSSPLTTEKLIQVSKIPIDPANINTIGESVLRTLWYHIFTIENSIEVFGGLAYYNTGKIYSGTGDPVEDWILNRTIPRYSRNNSIINVKKLYETNGDIEDPLIMMHNSLDPVVLSEQQLLYTQKISKKSNEDLFQAYMIDRYGHCEFTPEELFIAFNSLISMVAAQEY